MAPVSPSCHPSFGLRSALSSEPLFLFRCRVAEAGGAKRKAPLCGRHFTNACLHVPELSKCNRGGKIRLTPLGPHPLLCGCRRSSGSIAATGEQASVQTETIHFPATPIALKMAVAVGIGMLVGLEREWSNKDVGIRTFAIVALLGMLAAIMGPGLIITSLIGVFLLVAAMNARSVLTDRSLEITTSAALITDERAKLIFYSAFVDGQLDAPRSLLPEVHRLYFEPQYEEFSPRTMWSLSNAFTSAFKKLEPVPQFKATAKLGEFLNQLPA
jgi:hypothetical protein